MEEQAKNSEQVIISKFKIIHDRPECIGCGACAAVTPKYWEMNADGKSDIKEGKEVGETQELELEDLDGNMEAAEVCPVNCIHIYEKGQKKI